VGRFRPIGRRHIQTFCLGVVRGVGLVFAEVDVGIVFDVVKKDHVPKNDSITLLSIFEAGLHLKAGSTC
jgi:hypothetical protein